MAALRDWSALGLEISQAGGSRVWRGGGERRSGGVAALGRSGVNWVGGGGGGGYVDLAGLRCESGTWWGRVWVRRA